MTKLQSPQAEIAVRHFRELLDENARAAIGSKHFEELTLIIESAIDAAILEEVNRYATDLEDIVRRMKRSSERFESEAESLKS